ncbi:DUF3710 domain-containing protein [Pseudactinotalea suaedae]|uniref:DUF3710 domain-containing protein n=1 Tax=Pseudactinotalea suaedae TaxID=1524924 RepID=UPI0012E26793|nr:DUF3710 domain-containing protein [Pseudactinotalea suaedae]
MRWFSRKGGEKDAPTEDVTTDVETDETAGPDGRGPWDVEEIPEVGDRVDLGALRIPVRPGMQVRMELERKSRRIVAVNLGLEGSALQLQAFAAPRSAGLWEELREEIAGTITKQGGSAEEQDGPFGAELLARLPVRTPDGRSGHRPARFIGIDGPRWFVRGVLTGKAAVDEDAAAAMEDVLADVVVVRGHEARAPRDLLALHMPGKPGQEVPAATAARPSIDLGGPRGPEITEVR